jgi:hypothetical protein
VFADPARDYTDLGRIPGQQDWTRGDTLGINGLSVNDAPRHSAALGKKFPLPEKRDSYLGALVKVEPVPVIPLIFAGIRRRLLQTGFDAQSSRYRVLGEPSVASNA